MDRAEQSYRGLLLLLGRPREEGDTVLGRAHVYLYLSEVAALRGDGQRQQDHIASAFESGLDSEEQALALEANMLAAVFMIKALIPGMRERKFGRIVNITSAMVKSPNPAMGLSTAARAGLTALCKSLSRDVAIDNVTINNILPERIDTDRQKFMAERMMKLEKITYEEGRAKIVDTIAAKRFGRPEEFGDACAYLCSAQAGFISGQNLQLDGGSYRGLV